MNQPPRGDDQYYYDWQEAMKVARKEGWCDCIDTFVGLTFKHKRVPTKGMIAEHAVEQDFESLRGWLNNDWHWCGINVQDVETGVALSLWGLESSDEDHYHNEVIEQLADEMWDDVLKALLHGEIAEEYAA